MKMDGGPGESLIPPVRYHTSGNWKNKQENRLRNGKQNKYPPVPVQKQEKKKQIFFPGAFRFRNRNGNKSTIFSEYEVEKSGESVYIYRKCVNPY